MYEVEQKFRVSDLADLEAKLVGLAARFHEPVEQVDRYFAHPCRDFVKTDEALRLRRVGDDVVVTWKGPRIDSACKTRRELELGLAQAPPSPGGPGGGQATLDRWTELFEALGFRHVRDVAKRRRAARVLWQGTEVEAALDRVDGIGEFLELELQAAAGEVPLATACVTSLARTLGCDAQERRSYLELVIAANP